MRRSLTVAAVLAFFACLLACENTLRPELPVAEPVPAVWTHVPRGGTPSTQITFGPRTGRFWSPNVKYRWVGTDDDGTVVGYRYAFSSVEEFVLDGHVDHGNAGEYFAWLDTLTYRPLPGGERGPSPWIDTSIDSVEVFIPESEWVSLFGVRAVDDMGLEDPVLERDRNATAFRVRQALGGPRISLATNVGYSKRSGEADRVVEIFAQGMEFLWTGRPGQSQAPVTGYSYAVDDTASWSPISLSTVRFPETEGDYWHPTPGEHTFFVRGFDAAGYSNVLAAQFSIFPGPEECDGERYVLVVLDTDPDQLQQTRILPESYAAAERGLVRYWFEGYDYRVYETMGEAAPPVDLMDCASSIVWIHTSDVDAGDASVLNFYHIRENVLQTYVASGGNLLLCGIQPSEAVRFFHDPSTPIPIPQSYPVVFERTLTDSTFLAHWMATHFGIARIDETVGSTLNAPDSAPRLRNATSVVRGRFGSYPDLEFDPLTWPTGPLERGFGHYDRGVIPRMGEAEVVYEQNDTGIPIGVRRLDPPNGFGSTVYLGFHPYFIQRPQGRELFRTVLSDFGERRRGGGVGPGGGP